MHTFRSKVTVIVACTMTAAALILGLHSRHSRNKSSNGFVRTIAKDAAVLDTCVDIRYDSYYPAGSTKHELYLANSVATTRFIRVNLASLDTQHFTVTTSGNPKIAWQSLVNVVDSPNVYLTEGATPGQLFTSLQKERKVAYISLPEPFLAAIPVSPTSYVARIWNSPSKQSSLVKFSTRAEKLTVTPVFLERQQDGFFCTDGMLRMDHESDRLMYTYFYRNEFLCMDTSLNVLYKGKTIDTTYHAKIKLNTLERTGTTTFASPPLLVNKESRVAAGRIFICSGVKADNESQATFNQLAVIDVYDLANAQYQLSFYLPDYKDIDPVNFWVQDNRLFVIYDNFLVLYSLRLPIQ